VGTSRHQESHKFLGAAKLLEDADKVCLLLAPYQLGQCLRRQLLEIILESFQDNQQFVNCKFVTKIAVNSSISRPFKQSKNWFKYALQEHIVPHHKQYLQITQYFISHYELRHQCFLLFSYFPDGLVEYRQNLDQ